MGNGNELNELYTELAPAIREELSRHEERATVPAGTKLISQGAMPDYLIFIAQGTAQISVSAGGKALSLYAASGGKVLGLRAIVANVLPEIDATALTPCAIVRIPNRKFVEALKEHPEMYFAISKILSNDLKRAERVLRELSRSAGKEKQYFASDAS